MLERNLLNQSGIYAGINSIFQSDNELIRSDKRHNEEVWR